MSASDLPGVSLFRKGGKHCRTLSSPNSHSLWSANDESFSFVNTTSFSFPSPFFFFFAGLGIGGSTINRWAERLGLGEQLEKVFHIHFNDTYLTHETSCELPGYLLLSSEPRLS